MESRITLGPSASAHTSSLRGRRRGWSSGLRVISLVVVTLFALSNLQLSGDSVFAFIQGNFAIPTGQEDAESENQNDRRSSENDSVDTEKQFMLVAPQRRVGSVSNVTTGSFSKSVEDNLQRPANVSSARAGREQRVEDEASGSASQQNTSTDQLNIVLLYADDWTMKTLGLVNPVVKTPNIDALARRGMFFEHNCVTTSICWQSRASMFTGTTVAVHQALKISDDSIFRNGSRTPWEETLFPQLKHAGYHRGYVGKWHNAMPKPSQTPLYDWGRTYYGRHWINQNGIRTHVTEANRADALYYLRQVRPRDQKFMLTVSFFATHAQDGEPFETQFQPQNYSAPLYENVTIPTPVTATEKAWQNMPPFFTDQNEGRVRWQVRYETPEMFQYTMKNIYRMASEVDDVVGAIVQELKDQGLYNNTLIIFTTDNGAFHGEHGLADKWYPHEESIRVPLIIEDPRMPSHLHGSVNKDFTLNVDLAPTILGAAGIQAPPFMQGRDMAELYLSPKEAKKTWRQDFFYEYSQGDPANASGHGSIFFIPAVFALVQKRYKYFYWPQAAFEQMFDLEHDPYEERDLWNTTSRANGAVLDTLMSRYTYLKAKSQGGFPI